MQWTQSGVRLVAGGAALVGWAGLVLQYGLFVGKVGIALASWRYIGFFTILSNIGVALIATAIALGGKGWLTGARARLTGLTAILTVGLVYSVLLRALWDPSGLDKLADAILHDVTPILFAALWALMPHGQLKWADLKWALMPPALYLGYALTRGSADGWYPYFFLDPNNQSLGELLAWLAGVIMTFAAIAGCVVAVDMRLGRRRR